MSTGVGLIPNAPTSGATGAYNLATLAQNQGNAERDAAAAKKSNIQKFFGSFATQTGLTDAEKKKRAQLSGGLDITTAPKKDQNNIPDPFVVDPDKLKKKEDNQFGTIAV